MVQLIGNVRRPEATEMAVEDVTFDGLTQSRRAARRIGLPAREKRQRATERKVRRRGRLLKSDHVLAVPCAREIGNAVGFAIDRLEVGHSAASALASSRSNRAMKSGLRTASSP